MKIMKIKIKHEKVRLCTSDPRIALLVLANMERLDKVGNDGYTKVLGEEEAKMIIKKTQESFKVPEFAPAVKKFKSKRTHTSWTMAEDLRAIKLFSATSKEAQNDKFLRQRHTTDAIRARISKMRCGKINNFTKERKVFIERVLKSKETPTSTVDEIEESLEKKLKVIKKPNPNKTKPITLWTKRENQILIDNRNKKPRKIAMLLAGRSIPAISGRLSALKLKEEKRVNSKAVVTLAAWVGKTRLIDNILV